MKFVRVFALLFALIGVVDAVQGIANLLVVDSFDEAGAFWSYLIEGLAAGVFGYGAYVLTNNEDI